MALILKTVVFISIFELFKTQTLHSCYNVLGQRFRPDFEDCSKYHLCSPQKDWILVCPPGTTWNQDKNICVTKGSVEDTCTKQTLQHYKEKLLTEKVELYFPSTFEQLQPPLTSPYISSSMDRWSAKFFCPPGDVGRHAHPTRCAQFYDCDKTMAVEWWGQNLRECPYPEVFNDSTHECDSIAAVRCNSRQQPMDPCMYKTINQNIYRFYQCIECDTIFFYRTS